MAYPTHAGTSLKPNNNLADIRSPLTAFNNIKQAGSTSATGVVEIATQTEVDNAAAGDLVVTSSTLKKNQANGVAPLDASGLVPTANLPASAISSPANTIKGNNTGVTATTLNLTVAQTTAMLNAFVGDSGAGGTKGLVPAPAVLDATKFLKGDGTWGAPAGSGTVTSVSITAPAAGITQSGSPVTSAGAITLALADDLAGLEGVTGTGYARRTGTSTWTIDPLPIRTVVAQATSTGVTAAQSGTTFSNEGATGQVILTLPTAVAGLYYYFTVQDTDGLRVLANTADTIRIYNLVSISAGYVESAVRGSSLLLQAINATEWIGFFILGSWDVQTS